MLEVLNLQYRFIDFLGFFIGIKKNTCTIVSEKLLKHWHEEQNKCPFVSATFVLVKLHV